MLCKLGVIIFRFQTPPSWFSKSKTPQQWKYWVNKDLFDCFLCSRWCWFGGQTWPMDPRKQLLSLSTSLVHQPLACSATTTTTKKTQENDNCLEHNLTTVAFAIILHFQYICWNSILTWKVALLWSFCFLFQIQSKEWTNSGDSSFPFFSMQRSPDSFIPHIFHTHQLPRCHGPCSCRAMGTWDYPVSTYNCTTCTLYIEINRK